jgi:hypothetical protein
MVEPLNYSRSGEAMTKLVDDPRDDSEAALVLALWSTRLAARDPSLVGAKTDAKQRAGAGDARLCA